MRDGAVWGRGCYGRKLGGGWYIRPTPGRHINQMHCKYNYEFVHCLGQLAKQSENNSNHNTDHRRDSRNVTVPESGINYRRCLHNRNTITKNSFTKPKVPPSWRNLHAPTSEAVQSPERHEVPWGTLRMWNFLDVYLRVTPAPRRGSASQIFM